MEEYRYSGTECLDENQQDAFVYAMRYLVNKEFDAPYMILSGAGGSGKTTVIKSIIDITSTQPFIKSTVIALTGRACSHLIKSGVDAKTCHSIMYTPVIDLHGNLLRFEEKSISEIKDSIGDFVVADEASMIPFDIFEILVGLDIPVLFVGDKSQLPPVDKENPDFNIMELEDGINIELTSNHRQKEGSGIVELCNLLREDNTLPKRKNSDLKFIPKSMVTHKHFQQYEYDIILCGMNKTRKKINNQVREAKGFTGSLPQEGEQIVCLRNTIVNNGSLSNGELFVVDGAIYGDEVSKYFITSIDSGNSHTVNIANECWDSEVSPMRTSDGTPLVPFSYGYCISVHKSQGSQFDEVLFIDENVSFFIDQRKFRYTAVSRVVKHLTIGF